MDTEKILAKLTEISNNLGDLNIIPQRIETFLKTLKEELKIVNNEADSDYYKLLYFSILLLEEAKHHNYNLPQNGSPEFEKLIPKNLEGFEWRNYKLVGSNIDAKIHNSTQNDGFF